MCILSQGAIRKAVTLLRLKKAQTHMTPVEALGTPDRAFNSPAQVL